MKAPIRSRSRSRNNGNLPKSPELASSSDERDITFKASFEDLRSPDGRQSLRQHFTGAFPETHRKTSYSSFESFDTANSKPKTGSNLGARQNDAAGSSSSSLNSMGPAVGAKRLSTVRESNTAVDIEQAIRLLQELKKSASPEELVALHKALLPTRDSITASPSLPVNDEESGNVSSASMIRRRSMLPPGLATRANASEDILRRQEDVPVARKVKKRKSNLASPLSHSASHDTLAALDLAEEAVVPRAATPSEHDGYTQIGLYRHGTLRITNGAASPEPSISVSMRRSVELQAPDNRQMASITARSSVDQRASHDYYCTAPTTPQDRASQEFYLAQSTFRESMNMPRRQSAGDRESRQSEPERQSRQSGAERYSKQSDEDRRSRDPSQSRSGRQSRARGASISGIPVPRIRDESTPRIYKRSRAKRSRDDSHSTPISPEQLQISPTHSRIPLRVETQLSRPSFNILEPQVSKQSLTPIRPEIDDGRISPVGAELPRFAQRWSHRASKISEDAIEGALTANPYEDRSTLVQYENRTSLLKKLNAAHDSEANNTDTTTLETPEIALSKLNGDHVDETGVQQTVGVISASATELITPYPNYGSNRLERPVPPRHTDSGYGTDTSFQSSMGKTGPVEGIPIDDGDDVDGKSLYTFDQVLRSPSLLGDVSTPSPPATANQKHSSFLNLSSSRRGSSKLATSPRDSQAEAKQKKLQKPMPASVRKERKEQLNKLKRESEVAGAGGSEVQPTPPEVTSPHPRFSFEPVPKPASRPSTTVVVTELQGDIRQPPVELKGDDTFPAPDDTNAKSKLSFIRRRSKSRGRGRERSTSLQVVSSQNDVAQPELEDVSRGRSKSAMRSGNTTPTRSVFGVNTVSCISQMQDADNVTDDIPLWTDHASISRALGSSPYDPSTTLFKRTVSVPGAVMHQVQSPHQITTSFGRSKSGGLRGMDSGMASELARMKSRDVAIKNNEEVYDRPRMVKPKSRSGSKSRGAGRVQASVTAEDRHPRSEEDKLPSPRLYPEAAELSERRLSTYSESIPPMPELPADVRMKVSKVDEKVSKRLKDSAQPSPMVSARNSEERPGDSTISVAEAVRRAMEKRKDHDKRSDGRDRRSGRSRPSGPRRARQASLPHDMSTSSSNESMNVVATTKVVKLENAHSSSSVQMPQQPDMTGWEKQAKLWRERRESIGQSLGKPLNIEDEGSPNLDIGSLPTSPFVVESGQNTHQSPARWPMRRRTDSATQHADAYRELIAEPEDNANPIHSLSAPPSAAVQEYSEMHPASQSSTTLSLPSPQALLANVERARSPGGRVITPSGNFYPYTPADAARAERSRAASLAKLTGTDIPSSTESHDAQQRLISVEKKVDGSMFGRYSGGLEYNYERGAGVGGSAGTRTQADRARRKSKELSEGLGLDLSDVPFFMQKALFD